MISIERIRELIQLGNENLNLDYKGAFSWEQATSDQKCEIAKDVLAFSNARDGGVILIGVNDKTGVLEGLTEEQSSSFDQTKFNDFIQKYTDPRHTASVYRMTIDGKRVVVIDIPEFADVPILCARDANSSVTPNKLILRRAGLYKRTEKATSEPIQDADEMRDLLNRGLLRRQDDLLRAFKQIIQPSSLNPPEQLGAEFKSELESAELYFSELSDGMFSKIGHWDVQMQPEAYNPIRIPNLAALQKLVQASAISLRGWTFPIVGRTGNAPWSNFEHGSQSFYAARGHRPEALRVYRSGFVIWRAGLGEDYWSGLEDSEIISFIGIIYSTTEWAFFARRFFESILSVDESTTFTIRATGVKGRRLASLDFRTELYEDFRAEVQTFTIQERITMAGLRADPEAVARRIIRRIFEMFNWNDTPENILQEWQQKLIRRTF